MCVYSGAGNGAGARSLTQYKEPPNISTIMTQVERVLRGTVQLSEL